MIPTQSLENYPIFGSNATKIQPDSAKMAAGYQQADVLPAEWMNWKWNKDSRLITELQEGVRSMETEINNLLTGVGITPAEATTNQLLTAIKKMTYPVGSVYQNMLDPTNPATLLGFGTWAQINDKFLVAAAAASFTDGTNVPKYAGAGTGGSATYTLSEANIPQHSHAQQGTFSTASQSSTTTSAESANHTHTYGVAMAFQDTGGGGSYYLTPYALGGGWVGSEESHNSAYTIPVAGPANSANIRTISLGGTTSVDSSDHTHQFEHTHSITIGGNTGSYGYASPTAISIVPSYQAVYTWYRTA